MVPRPRAPTKHFVPLSLHEVQNASSCSTLCELNRTIRTIRTHVQSPKVLKSLDAHTFLATFADPCGSMWIHNYAHSTCLIRWTHTCLSWFSSPLPKFGTLHAPTRAFGPETSPAKKHSENRQTISGGTAAGKFETRSEQHCNPCLYPTSIFLPSYVVIYIHILHIVRWCHDIPCTSSAPHIFSFGAQSSWSCRWAWCCASGSSGLSAEFGRLLRISAGHHDCLQHGTLADLGREVIGSPLHSKPFQAPSGTHQTQELQHLQHTHKSRLIKQTHQSLHVRTTRACFQGAWPQHTLQEPRALAWESIFANEKMVEVWKWSSLMRFDHRVLEINGGWDPLAVCSWSYLQNHILWANTAQYVPFPFPESIQSCQARAFHGPKLGWFEEITRQHPAVWLGFVFSSVSLTSLAHVGGHRSSRPLPR